MDSIQLMTPLGEVYVRFETATQARVGTTTSTLIVEGRHFQIAAVLHCVDGAWGLPRTKRGNESEAALFIFELKGDAGRRTSAPTFRAIRDAVVNAVAACAQTTPDVLRAAERKARSAALHRAEVALSNAKAAQVRASEEVVKCAAALAALDAEAQS